MLVHGEQAITLHRPIPVQGEVSTVGQITGIYDKGKGAVVEVRSVSTDVSSGEPLFTNVMSAFIRGEGGWGGDRGPSGPKNVPPDRAPDREVTYQTRIDQALLYRLSGDRNPLHSDPAFAAMGGFDRPILHGLCTYGFTGRALLHALCDGDPARLTAMEGRFTSPVLPGEALTVRMWTGDDGAVFQTTGSDGRVVLDAGKVTVG
jgi:acyl dehydratase